MRVKTLVSCEFSPAFTQEIASSDDDGRTTSAGLVMALGLRFLHQVLLAFLSRFRFFTLDIAVPLSCARPQGQVGGRRRPCLPTKPLISLLFSTWATRPFWL
mmetsp:Transcript_56640/g.120492  ORF Transcript_56640/g.120492 Transcript_56640/m.120492 type:complete len:102 (+) Transcript_56640:741-1046(+)